MYNVAMNLTDEETEDCAMDGLSPDHPGTGESQLSQLATSLQFMLHSQKIERRMAIECRDNTFQLYDAGVKDCTTKDNSGGSFSEFFSSVIDKDSIPNSELCETLLFAWRDKKLPAIYEEFVQRHKALLVDAAFVFFTEHKRDIIKASIKHLSEHYQQDLSEDYLVKLIHLAVKIESLFALNTAKRFDASTVRYLFTERDYQLLTNVTFNMKSPASPLRVNAIIGKIVEILQFHTDAMVLESISQFVEAQRWQSLDSYALGI